MGERSAGAPLLRTRDEVDLSFERTRALLETLAAVYAAHGEVPTHDAIATVMRLALDQLNTLEQLWHECEELYRATQERPRSLN